MIDQDVNKTKQSGRRRRFDQLSVRFILNLSKLKANWNTSVIIHEFLTLSLTVFFLTHKHTNTFEVSQI